MAPHPSVSHDLVGDDIPRFHIFQHLFPNVSNDHLCPLRQIVMFQSIFPTHVRNAFKASRTSTVPLSCNRTSSGHLLLAFFFVSRPPEKTTTSSFLLLKPSSFKPLSLVQQSAQCLARTPLQPWLYILSPEFRCPSLLLFQHPSFFAP